jgi:hypothetical protein
MAIYSLETLRPSVKPLDFRGTRLTKARRAALAAQLVAEQIPVVLRAAHAAKVLSVSLPYVTCALALSPEERRAVYLGERALAEPENPQEQLGKLVSELGVDSVLDFLAAADAA